MKSILRWIAVHPVATLGIVVAGMNAFLGYAAAEHLLSGRQIGWATAIELALTAIGTAAAHSSVTPLARPRDARLRPLVPRKGAKGGVL